MEVAGRRRDKTVERLKVGRLKIREEDEAEEGRSRSLRCGRDDKRLRGGARRREISPATAGSE